MARRTKVSFATCNLYNINLPRLKIYRDYNGWSDEEFALKLQWLSSLVAKVNADIWGFQELWHYQALEQVFERAGLKDNYTLLAPESHQGKAIICAGAVRSDILVGEPEWIKQFPDKFKLEGGGSDPQTSDIKVAINTFSRPVLHFNVRPRRRGKVISVYVAHLKSKAPTSLYREGWYRDDNEYYKRHSKSLGAAISTIRRTAEAAALRMVLTEEMKNNDNPVVILGDLNDGQHSNTLNILTEQPNYLFSGYKGGGDAALYTVETLQEYRSLRDVYYTHIYQNSKESLDHILVSQEFYDQSKKRLWLFKGMEIINDHLNDENHKETGTTDHGIVKATFEYNPNK